MSAPSAFGSTTRTCRTSRPSGTRSTTSAPSSDRADPAPGAEPGVLEARLGHRFASPELLAQALAHRSWVAESAGAGSNERLEFLGDAVLGLVVADQVYARWPDLPEGDLAKMRAAVVSTTALAEIGQELGLGEAVLLGRGEELSGGREKPSILTDATEALIGAVYLDGGWEAARGVVLRLLGHRLDDAASGPGGHDFKTRLQELAQQRFDASPSYVVVDEGPDHAKRFYASVRVGGRTFGGGEGRSKKQAEQAVARLAWEELRGA